MCILIVDDNAIIADAIRHMLADEHETVYAGDGEAARKLLVSGDGFDVVLSDVRMPRLGGLGLLEWVGAARVDLLPRFVFMTTNRGIPEAQQIARSHQVLVKPFTRAALLAAIRALGVRP